MFREVKGDLIKYVVEHKTNVAHGCNCFNTMGAGVALPVRQMWPEMYAADCRTVSGDKNKLGTTSYAKIGPNQWGFNLYTQYNYGRYSPQLFKLEYLRNALGRALYIIDTTDSMVKELAVPLIGAGLGGGNAQEVKALIKELAEMHPNVTVTLVLL